MNTTTIEHHVLTPADRCDRCGAQAYVRITLRNGSELLFCAHHARAHKDKLKQVACIFRMTPQGFHHALDDGRRLGQR